MTGGNIKGKRGNSKDVAIVSVVVKNQNKGASDSSYLPGEKKSWRLQVQRVEMFVGLNVG